MAEERGFKIDKNIKSKLIEYLKNVLQWKIRSDLIVRKSIFKLGD